MMTINRSQGGGRKQKRPPFGLEDDLDVLFITVFAHNLQRFTLISKIQDEVEGSKRVLY